MRKDCFHKSLFEEIKKKIKYEIFLIKHLKNAFYQYTENFPDKISYFFLQNNGVLLFLAKDVFSTCDLMQNNVQRIHARYSKEGLATKVNFEGKFIYKKLERILHLTVGV